MDSIAELTALRKADIVRASQMFARAFDNDPLLAHLIPDAARRRSLSPRLYRCVLRYGLHYGRVVATSPNWEGAAVWLPPQAAHASLPRMFRAGKFALPFRIGPRFTVRALKCHRHLDRLRRHHTPFSHWYLQLLGVEPQHQGKGNATALLAPMLVRSDHERVPCCLDTMNGENVTFYERFGFQVLAHSVVPKTNVGIWLLARAEGTN